MKKPKRKRNKPKKLVPAPITPLKPKVIGIGARAHVLMWLGAAMVCLSALGGLQTLIDFSPWASWILNNWLSLTDYFWSRALAWTGIELEPYSSIPLTFLTGIIGLAFSAARLEHIDYYRLGKVHPLSAAAGRKFGDILSSREYSLRLAEGVAIGGTVAATLSIVGNLFLFDNKFRLVDFIFPWAIPILLTCTLGCFAIILFVRPFRDFWHTLMLATSMIALYFLMLLPAALAARTKGNDELWSLAFMVTNLSIFWLPAKLMNLVAFARPRYWNYRFIFVWLTLFAILALDQVAIHFSSKAN